MKVKKATIADAVPTFQLHTKPSGGWDDIDTQPHDFDQSAGWPGLVHYRKIVTDIPGIAARLETWTPCWTMQRYLNGTETITLPEPEDDEGHDLADLAAALNERFPPPAWAVGIDPGASAWGVCYGHVPNYYYYSDSADAKSRKRLPYTWIGLVRLPAPAVRLRFVEDLLDAEIDGTGPEPDDDDAEPYAPLAETIGPEGLLVIKRYADEGVPDLDRLPLRWVEVNSTLLRLDVDHKAPGRRDAARKGRAAAATRQRERAQRDETLRRAVAALADAIRHRVRVLMPRAADVSVDFTRWDADSPRADAVGRLLEIYATLVGLDKLPRIPAFGAAVTALYAAEVDKQAATKWDMPHELRKLLEAGTPRKRRSPPPTTPLVGGRARCCECGREGVESTFVLPPRLEALRLLWAYEGSRHRACPRCLSPKVDRSAYQGPIALDADGDPEYAYDQLCGIIAHAARSDADRATLAAQATEIADSLRTTLAGVEALASKGVVA